MLTALKFFATAWQSIVAIFYPYFCLVCDEHFFGYGLLCSTCQARKSPVVSTAISVGSHVVPVATMFLYQPPFDSLLHAKFINRPEVFVRLGYEVDTSWLLHVLGLPEDNLVLLGVPMFARKERLRGFNQCQLFAASLASRLGARLLSCVRRVKDTVAQKDLNKTQRRENIRGAFWCDELEPLEGKDVLVVDDLLTTGATLQELIVTIAKAKPRSISCLVALR